MMDCLTSHHGALLRMCHVFNRGLTEVLLEWNVGAQLLVRHHCKGITLSNVRLIIKSP